MQRRITIDLLTYLPARALPALAGFITLPIYTRMFSPAEFGNYVLAVTASEFLLLATVTGFGQAAVRFFSAYQLKSNLSSFFSVLFGSVGLFTLVAAAASSGLLLFFSSRISSDLYPLLWAAVVLYVVSSFNNTLMDILRAQENSRWYSAIWISQCYGGIIFGLILVLVFRMRIVGLIWGQTLGLLLPIILLLWLTTRSVTIRSAPFNRSDYKQLWAFALPFTIANIAFWTLSLSDRYIIELFRGSYEVGLYSVAAKIPSKSIALLVSLFYLVPVPMVSRLWEERGRQAAEEALTRFTRMYFLMLIPTVVGLTVVAAPMMRLLTDEAYFGGYRAIWLVACASLALGLIELGRIGCMVSNRTGLIARNQCVAAGVNVILTFILVPILGFMGAALSSLLSFSLLAGLQAITSARFLTWRWPLKSLGRVLAASAAMSAAVLLLQAGLPTDTTVWQVVNLLMSIMVGAIVYALVLWALREISPHQILDLLRVERRPATISPVSDEPAVK